MTKSARTEIDWYKILTSDPYILGDIAVTAINKGKTKTKKPVPVMDHTTDPFPVAFLVLRGDLSLSKLANKLNLPKSTVYNFCLGTQEPTLEQIRVVAKGFGKKPKYFREYRFAIISKALESHLVRNPQVSTDLASKLKDSL